MKSILTIAALTVLLGGVAVATLQGANNGDLTQGAFPNRVPHSVALPTGSQGIDQRVTELSADLLLPKDADIDFKNGETGQDLYRDNGTMQHREVYYKQLPGKPKQLKWQASIGLDGVTYMDDTAFWPDGSRQRVGNRQADGSYLILTYFAGGQTEQSRSIIGADGKGLFQRIVRDNGKLAYLGQKTKDGIEETTYSEDGHKLKYSMRNFSTKRKTEFYPNSDDPKSDIIEDSFNYTTISYAPGGKIIEKYLVQNSSLTVFHYENGVPKYMQYWLRTNTAEAVKGAPSVWQLYSIAVIDDQEKEHWKLWFKTGDKVTTLVPSFTYESLDGLPTEKSHSVKVSYYTDAGCLREEIWQDAQFGKEVKKIMYPQDRGCSTIPLPADMLKPMPADAPVKKIPAPEPHEP